MEEPHIIEKSLVLRGVGSDRVKIRSAAGGEPVIGNGRGQVCLP